MSSSTDKNSDQKGRKRKRTQGLSDINLICQPKSRPLPLLPPIMANSSSPTLSGEFSGLITEEDIQLVKNLILLSQGGNLIDQAAKEAADQSSGTPTSQSQPPPTDMEKVSAELEIEIEQHDSIVPSRQLVESTAPTPDNYFPCKICNKKFKSHQALGGHLSSHKKIKQGSDEPQMQSSTDTDTDPTSSGKLSKLDTITKVKDDIQVNSPGVGPPALADNKTQLHKCPRCPAAFNSGQALGGHMRKHNPLKPKTEKSNDGLDGIATQPLISGQDSTLIQQQLNNNPDRIAIQRQQPPNGDRNIIEIQQQPNDSLVLDLNLPAQPDQQDIIEQPPAAFLSDRNPPAMMLLLGMLG